MSDFVRVPAPVREKLTNDRVLTIRLYCENPDCPARTIDVLVKDHEASPLLADQWSGRCPICGRGSLSLHHVLTREQQNEIDERDARGSVNTQMYKRREREKDPDRLVAIPESVFLDDRLPPLPDGWFTDV